MSQSSFRRLAGPIAIAVFALAPGGADARRQGQQGRLSLVTLDFRAYAEDGQPITDLKPEELVLKINGRQKEIRVLQVVQVAAKAPAGATPLAAPFSTNAVTDAARDVLMVFDDDSIAPGREDPMKHAMVQLIDALSQGDRVGLLSVRDGGIVLPLTSEHTTIKSAVTGIRGQASTTQTATDTCRTQRVLQGLTTILGNISSDAPVTVIFFSAAFASPDAQRQAVMGQSSGLCQLRTEDFQGITVNAALSQANFYVVHLLDGTGTIDTTNTLAAGLENLAGATGGELVRLTGSNETAILRVARETTAYYVAAFDAEPSDRGQSNQRVELRTTRERIKVRVRPVLAPGRLAGRAAPTAKETLTLPRVFRELPLRALGHSSRNPGDDKIKIVTMFEPVEPTSKLASAVVGIIDEEKHKLIAQWTAEPQELARNPVMSAVTVAPGTYRLRVAAVDSNGRVGTVDSELRAEFIRADPLRMSTPILGVPRNGNFAPKLQFDASDEAAVALFEIYGGDKSSAITAEIQIAETAEGPALATVPATVSAANSGDLRIAYGGFSIGALKPGDYQVRALVSLGGKPVGKVTRTLRKVTS
jgi:hypothetical protein